MGFNPDWVQISIKKLQKAFKGHVKAVRSDPENDAKRAMKRKAD